MLKVYDAEEKLRDEQYTMKCKVEVKDISYLDEQSKENVQRTEKMVFLLPNFQASEAQKFLRAWLPETREEHFEVIIEAGHPIFGYFKGAVMRINERCSQHHIFVMSRGAEEDLKMLDGKDIIIKVLGQGDEKKGDEMRDFALADDRSKEIVQYSQQRGDLE